MSPLPRRALAALAAALTMTLGVLTAAPASALPAYRVTPTRFTNPQAVSPQVVNLRFSEHRTFDRVVIDVNGRRPGFLARYVSQLRGEASGQPVPLRGRFKLMLTLHPARTFDNSGDNVYRGPRRVAVHFPTLKGIVFLGDFEGFVSFGFGVRTRPYRAFTLTNPSRVVLDWKHVG